MICGIDKLQRLITKLQNRENFLTSLSSTKVAEWEEKIHLETDEKGKQIAKTEQIGNVKKETVVLDEPFLFQDTAGGLSAEEKIRWVNENVTNTEAFEAMRVLKQKIDRILK